MEADWKEPPAALALGSHEVHVWRVQVEEWIPAVDHLQTFLNREEQARAQRFYFENDRQRSIIARGLLRVLLGRYCAIEPGQILFAYNEFGKPELATPGPVTALYFNLAHSNTQIVYAFTAINRIGVDIEYMRANIEYEQVAERFFSAHEKAQLQTVPSEQKMLAFFAGWTRKEAYIKARGKGLSIPWILLTLLCNLTRHHVY
ncbi:4'-phosphopantetheinyl transferase family protein [Dictyobacter kobayashii]|uniref:Uncharacterized protein n=1 Tax=Dictyobacter kobayashii TaxID=2014872 RepID=A0A402ABF9_9CHLR|nr:4'-phosphopantetheinyl transferase superfamily protein [Dictyobacter kobayashii]GCE16429.1 hypothetical protein KDK_02290 [Dictyobacter kobayashii]